MTIQPTWLDPYLSRLGIADPGEPSPESLAALHRAHVERIAYENIDIQLGRPQSIDPADSIRRVLSRRGGYCFNLNGALSTLLAALGYRVTRHRGAVHNGEQVPTPDRYGNHMAVTVDLDGGIWMVDAGLSNAHYEPMRLVEGEHQQGPFVFRLERAGTWSPDIQAAQPDGASPNSGAGQSAVASPNGEAVGGDSAAVGIWRFVQDTTLSSGSFAAMDFTLTPADWTQFLPYHAELSTAPTSPFVKTAQVYRRDAQGTDYIIGCVLHRIEGRNAPTKRELTSAAEWFEAATDLFGLDLTELTADDRERLWRRVRAAHEERLAEQAAAAALVEPVPASASASASAG